MKKKTTATTLRRMKRQGRPITMVTAYDATFARLAARGGADVLLVGDSLGMVVQGQDTTLPVTLEEIAYHTRAVARGAGTCHVVADMPFMTYQAGSDDALRNAGRLLKEGGAHAVKLEGGREIAETVERMVRAGIPVMGHVGLTPQSVHAMGGFRVQGRTAEAAARIVEDARALEDAGAYGLVLEGVPTELAARVTESVAIPTIGIGAGPGCDGQVLVIYDLLGLSDGLAPKFVKRYAELGDAVVGAVRAFRDEVTGGGFPAPEHTYEAAEPLFGPRPLPPEGETADEAPAVDEPAPTLPPASGIEAAR
ncbi:MAG TPA: 3-methyl-2-oxobutanoate hydroxymethyltransferase [Myxococcales bacterium LLY-WYZ-16_1]|jgi:3-methyl-2-oxobutanoate hydroxymethyltransferase|nr:3-methyl-2-oxobutanoate hydroxymethyltransferase [Myxococcales bacterium LLY-WYZ-16_1]